MFEDWIYNDLKINKDVSLIVHTLREVNAALRVGQYFFTEVTNQGVLLYYADAKLSKEASRPKFVDLGSRDPQRAYLISEDYGIYWRRSATQFLSVGRESVSKGDAWTRFAAFQLHQATEVIYRMVLLTVTLYAPATHHLGKMRQRCEAIDPRLATAWAPDQKPYKRYFELPRRAYVEARYSPAYETTPEILKCQADRIGKLLTLADTACQERLERLKASVEAAS